MSPKILALCLTAILISAFGQIALKAAVVRADLKGAIATGPIAALTAAGTSALFWGAMVIYGIGVLLWLWVLSETEVSLAYPLVSLGFVVTMVLASVMLHETISPMRMAGTLLIVAGCFLVGRSA